MLRIRMPMTLLPMFSDAWIFAIVYPAGERVAVIVIWWMIYLTSDSGSALKHWFNGLLIWCLMLTNNNWRITICWSFWNWYEFQWFWSSNRPKKTMLKWFFIWCLPTSFSIALLYFIYYILLLLLQLHQPLMILLLGC